MISITNPRAKKGRSWLSLRTDGPKNDSIVVDSVERLAFVSPSMDFEVIAEVFMPIRKGQHNQTSQDTQEVDFERYIASAIAATTACYTDRKAEFRVLCAQSNHCWVFSNDPYN